MTLQSVVAAMCLAYSPGIVCCFRAPRLRTSIAALTWSASPAGEAPRSPILSEICCMKAPGAELRDSIAALLRMRYSNVEVEARLGATTADVLFVDDTQPIFPRKIAIEAKDWGKALSSQDLAAIYNLYAPALLTRQIDNLWIVGRQPLSGSPRQSVDAMANVAYTTFDQFQASLINFLPLLQHNVSVFQQDSSYKNFIPARTRYTGASLFTSVKEWLAGAKSGLVVYGGYGLGKTTFSKYLASTLSTEYLSGSFDRIPVRFTLGDIYHKQDLTSLISSALAAAEGGVQIKNFTFSLFLEMNRLGKLLLIFDGFDEMRHAIEIDDFVFNFQQMRSLLEGNAKVVILGRPDIFLSTKEEQRVLSSMFDDPRTAIDKLELTEVGFFDRADIDLYLSAFMEGRQFSEEKRAKINELVTLMPATSEDNILSRPVQLSMFTRVIDDVIEEGTTPTRYALYESFIYRFIARERTKRARALPQDTSKIGQDDRALFMQNAAWWILNSKKENRFLPSDITRGLIPRGLSQSYSDDAALRESLIGSVIEPMDHDGVLGKKGNRYYYFPHKSYIEFLVAQYFSYGRFSSDVYRSFIENATPEILSFVAEGPTSGLENLRTGLDHATSRIPAFVVEVAAKDPAIGEELRSRGVNKANVPRLYTYYAYLRNGDAVGEFLRRQIAQTGVSGRMLAVINCCGDYLLRTGDVAVARAIVLNFLTSIFDEHKLRDYATNRRPAELFRDDETAVKAGALSSAIELSSSHVSVFPERLMEFALATSVGIASVELPSQGSYKKIALSKALLVPPAGSPHDQATATVETLLSSAGERRTHDVPVVLKGDAERYSLGSRV